MKKVAWINIVEYHLHNSECFLIIETYVKGNIIGSNKLLLSK